MKKEIVALIFLLSVLLACSKTVYQGFNCKVSLNNSRRFQVSGTPEPYAMVAYVKMHRRNDIFGGSACLIHPRVLLTAGHNLRKKNERRRVHKLQIWMGALSPTSAIAFQEFNTSQNENIFTLQSFDDDYTINEDFSIAILPDSSLYKKVGKAFRLTVFDSSYAIQMNSRYINLSGYPGDKDEFALWSDSTKNWVSNKWGNITYDTYTYTRLSGGPVWIFDHDYKVFAIHTQGNKKHKQCSLATPITRNTYQQIVAWCRSKGIDLEN